MEIRQASVEDFTRVNELYDHANQYHADLLPEQVRRLKPAITHDWFATQLLSPLKSFQIVFSKNTPLGMIEEI